MVRGEAHGADTPRFLVCHFDPDIREGLVNTLRTIGDVEAADTLSRAVELLALGAAGYLVVGLPPDRHGRSTLAQVVAAYPTVKVMVLASDLPFEIARELLRIGVADVLPYPSDPKEFVAAVRAVMAGQQVVPEKLKGTSIVIVSGKGGSGCTTLAVHMAAILASKSAAILVDGDAPPFGTTGPAVDMDAPVTVAALVRQRFTLEPKVIRQAASLHPSGFALLPLWGLAEEPQNLENVLGAVLEALAAAYPFVVIDVGRPVIPQQRILIRRAAVVLAVTTMDLLSLRNIRHLIDLVTAEATGGTQLVVALNRRDREESYTVEQVARALGRDAAFVLPYTPHLRRCSDRGELLTTAVDRCPWLATLEKLAEGLVARRQAEVRSVLQ